MARKRPILPASASPKAKLAISKPVVRGKSASHIPLSAKTRAIKRKNK